MVFRQYLLFRKLPLMIQETESRGNGESEQLLTLPCLLQYVQIRLLVSEPGSS